MNPELFGSRIFISPASAPKREQSPAASETLKHIDHATIVGFNESQAFRYLTEDLRTAEIALYGANDAEAKIIFLGGSPEWIISDEKTLEGVSIYKDPPSLPKLPEIIEFVGAANAYTDQKPGSSLETVISEAADLVYNFGFLSKVDTYEHAPDYTELIQIFAESLGWSSRDALIVAAIKYHQRFVHNGEKNPDSEDQALKRLIQTQDPLFGEIEPIVHPPTREEVGAALKLAVKIRSVYLVSRYDQIRFQKERAALAASKK